MAEKQATEENEPLEVKANETEQVENQEIDYKAEYEAMKTANESITAKYDKLNSDNSGLNKKVGELDRFTKELLKKTETEKETKEREAEESRLAEQARLDGITTREATLIEKENSLLVKEKAVELDFTVEERAIMLEMGINTVKGVELYREAMDEKAKKTGEHIIKAHKGKPEGGYNNKNNSVDTSFLNDCRA